LRAYFQGKADQHLAAKIESKNGLWSIQFCGIAFEEMLTDDLRNSTLFVDNNASTLGTQ
jgi:hypothetical protein